VKTMANRKPQVRTLGSESDAGLLTALADRAVIALGGKDARAFLQRILTQDMAQVVPGRAVPAALLTPQGKLQHLLLLTAGDDGRILVETSKTEVADLLRLLTLYRLRADVTFTPMDQATVFAADPTAMARIGPCVDGKEAIVVAEDTRAPDRLMRLYALMPEQHEQVSGLPHTAEGLETYARLRAEAGIAEGPRELPPGRLFALEANLDCIGAVSFSKGCYVGQEVTTRSYRRGRVKKRLLPFFVDSQSGTPAMGDKLARAGDEAVVGEVVATACHGLGWALCRIEAIADLVREGRLACMAQGVRLMIHLPSRLRPILEAEAAGGNQGEERR